VSEPWMVASQHVYPSPKVPECAARPDGPLPLQPPPARLSIQAWAAAPSGVSTSGIQWDPVAKDFRARLQHNSVNEIFTQRWAGHMACDRRLARLSMLRAATPTRPHISAVYHSITSAFNAGHMQATNVN
jgi:hypothetical protein